MKSIIKLLKRKSKVEKAIPKLPDSSEINTIPNLSEAVETEPEIYTVEQFLRKESIMADPEILMKMREITTWYSCLIYSFRYEDYSIDYNRTHFLETSYPKYYEFISQINSSLIAYQEVLTENEIQPNFCDFWKWFNQESDYLKQPPWDVIKLPTETFIKKYVLKRKEDLRSLRSSLTIDNEYQITIELRNKLYDYYLKVNPDCDESIWHSRFKIMNYEQLDPLYDNNTDITNPKKYLIFIILLLLDEYNISKKKPIPKFYEYVEKRWGYLNYKKNKSWYFTSPKTNGVESITEKKEYIKLMEYFQKGT